MNKLLIILLAFLLLIAPLTYAKNADNQLDISSNNQLLNGYQRIGSGLMKVMFWQVYQAELYAKLAVNQPTFDKNTFPQALKINYLRDIDKEDLVDATADQWQHLNMESTKQDQWIKDLTKIFPNIQEGDAITLVVDQNKVSTFYLTDKHSKNRKLGIIQDVEFGTAFLAIWLSKNTSRPALRSKLLGEK